MKMQYYKSAWAIIFLLLSFTAKAYDFESGGIIMTLLPIIIRR